MLISFTGLALSPLGAAESAETGKSQARAHIDANGEGARLGQPRRDLTPAQLAAFEAGKQLFLQKPAGIGPYFNDEACSDCHSIPTLGGSGGLNHVAFMGARDAHTPHEDGRPRGDVATFPRNARPGWTVPSRPANASQRIPPPLYGLGLIEQIPDATIRAACGKGHPNTAKQHGSLPRNSVARFGGKPFLGTIADFSGTALFGESGVTNPIEPGNDGDAFPDPEVDAKYVESLAAYIRGLAPPGRNGTDAKGEAAFRSFGCASCHVPDMPPANDVFSDFCLHAMGKELADGIFDHEAQGDEFRTTPLHGLRFRTLYLHDGRATSLDAAIVAHGGEAAESANAYKGAPQEQRAALLRFLDTL